MLLGHSGRGRIYKVFEFVSNARNPPVIELMLYKVFHLPKTLFIQVFVFIVQVRYWWALFRQPIASLYHKNKHLDECKKTLG